MMPRELAANPDASVRLPANVPAELLAKLTVPVPPNAPITLVASDDVRSSADPEPVNASVPLVDDPMLTLAPPRSAPLPTVTCAPPLTPTRFVASTFTPLMFTTAPPDAWKLFESEYENPPPAKTTVPPETDALTLAGLLLNETT
jgi:hypothetical protein